MFLCCSISIGSAQSTLIGDCDLKVFGRSDSTAFVSFDKDLRGALKSEDVGKLALLLKYPFRVNDALGTYYLRDAASFSGRFKEIFGRAVRDAVSNTRLESVWCNYGGITYGNGVIWVNPDGDGYALETVNVPGGGELHNSGLAFVCNTERHRVIVDHGPDENFRYRAWNKPKLLLDKPDLEISNGKETHEGTGPCVHAIWLFKSGSTEFKLEESGPCDPDVPHGTNGRLVVSAPGKPDVEWRCH